jgi:hypothetical protein
MTRTLPTLRASPVRDYDLGDVLPYPRQQKLVLNSRIGFVAMYLSNSLLLCCRRRSDVNLSVERRQRCASRPSAGKQSFKKVQFSDLRFELPANLRKTNSEPSVEQCQQVDELLEKEVVDARGRNTPSARLISDQRQGHKFCQHTQIKLP